MTRFFQAIAWPWNDITRRKTLDVNTVPTWLPSVAWPLLLFTAQPAEQDSAHAVKGAGRWTTRWLNSAFLLSCFFIIW